MKPIPQPDNETSLLALRAMWRKRTLLAALEQFHHAKGDIFRVTLPGFFTVFMAGPEAARFVLVSQRENLLWRSEGDPVVKLLRHGVLVEDGKAHDDLRQTMMPALHRKMVESYAESMVTLTDEVIQHWHTGQPVEMLDEMRKIALLILTQTLFGIDFKPDLEQMWQTVLKTIDYISPGLWIVWKRFPRLGYDRALRRMDAYLYHFIKQRRARRSADVDMVSMLIEAGFSDELIRDQLLTMLIAGHDTSTALLAWALYALTTHPDMLARAQNEVDHVIGTDRPNVEHVKNLPYLGRVINETLRLYPPIHLSARTAATDLQFSDYELPQNTRVIFSIYLTHRHPDYWSEPERFNPDRFEQSPAPYTFLPFGGGKRNCIGTAFAQLESKLVLARILQQFDLTFVGRPVRAYMKATLEPYPGVTIQATPRR